MRVVPRTIVPQIQFYELHAAKWAADPAPIGVDPALVAQLQAETAAARAAFLAQQQARNAARSATLALRIASEKMKRTGSNLIMQIRTKAATDGDGVYPKASIAVPADPSRLGPPGKPESINADLHQIGWLTLRWKCKNPRGSTGTMYHIHRRTEPNGPFHFLGASGKKKFVDRTLPAGAGVVEYRIQAMRSTAVGEMAYYQINLGVSGSGGAMLARFIPSRRSTIAA